MAIYVKSTSENGSGTLASPYTVDQFKSIYASGTTENVILRNTSIAATSLNEINALTSGTINAFTVTTITGAIADLLTTYTSGGITGLTGRAVTLSDTTVSAANLNSLDSSTSGMVDASTVTDIEGAIADLLTIYASSGITGLNNEAVTLSDTTVSAANLNSLDTSTSGVIDASTVTTITGAIADLLTTYASSSIRGLTDEAVTLSDTTVSATDLLNLITKTSGSVNVSTLTSVTGSGSDRSAVAASDRFTGFTSPNVVCFLAGTLISTPTGERSVESLEIGDEVFTKSGVQQIKFVSRSSRNIFQLMELGKLPICIQAGALGDAGPTQDLWISPSHAVLLIGHLIEASALLNGSTITQPDDPGSFQVTYYNIELENHEIFRANGLEVETYYANWRGEGYSRQDWDNYEEYISLYGESKGMKELDMPRIPFARQLPAELRLMLQMNESNQVPALTH